MCKILGPASLYTFMKFCNKSSLDKLILDCGAGGNYPPLSMFYEHGYKTKGVEISDDGLKKSEEFCRKNNMELNIIKGDMTELPFDDESTSFVYSYNSIFHLTKKNTLKALNEMLRVLSPDGLCFVNFLSIDDCGYGEGSEVNTGEFEQCEYGKRVIHSYYEDNEPDKYFKNFEILRKEKRIIEQKFEDKIYKLVYLDYIVKKLSNE